MMTNKSSEQLSNRSFERQLLDPNKITKMIKECNEQAQQLGRK